jgi:Cu/Ag efflux pump CusA
MLRQQSKPEQIAALAAVLLLFLTAWGNAVAMMIVSSLCLLIGLLLVNRSGARHGAIIAIAAGIVASLIAIGFALG